MSKSKTYASYVRGTAHELTTKSKQGVKSSLERKSKQTKRCECCGIDHSIDDMHIVCRDDNNCKRVNICKYCLPYYSTSTLLRYTYSIQHTPASWLTYSYTMKGDCHD